MVLPKVRNLIPEKICRRAGPLALYYYTTITSTTIAIASVITFKSKPKDEPTRL